MSILLDTVVEDCVNAVGLPTARYILAELDKPGRDPRPEFRMARYISRRSRSGS
jgi:transcriptional accessory protein Tex/SPT6